VYVLCGILILILVLLHRQNVVIVGAGRSSRSAKFATSSELLYLLNLLYNMPSECCDEYNLYNLNQKSSVWCFASSHTSTFELIPQSRGRPVGSLGDTTTIANIFALSSQPSRPGLSGGVNISSKQEIHSVELGVCPMQLFHLEQYLHYLYSATLKQYGNRMIFH